MKSLWNDKQAKTYKNNDLALRVYTSQLLGKNPDLVLHGGGNTSVKSRIKDDYGQWQDVLYVKGSGWDLATIEKEGFAPVLIEPLLKMAEMKTLSDPKMVKLQRAAMLNPYAPNPSVEAILHALIPFKFVDHTHADSVVTITNTPDGLDKIKSIYKDRVLIVPYVMPGFILAKKIYNMFKDADWSKYEGMILMNHGVFTFHDDPKKSYELMIKLVSEAEKYILKNTKKITTKYQSKKPDLLKIAKLRKLVSQKRNAAVVVHVDTSPTALNFSNLKQLQNASQQGPLTPDHVIRTKRLPLLITDKVENDINSYEMKYFQYFNRFKTSGLTILDSAPRWAVEPKVGAFSFGTSLKEAGIIADISQHTMNAIMNSEQLGGWKALSAKDIFEVEYWDLEQAKLKKAGAAKEFQGKVVIVTGAASGIGRATVERLSLLGANVVGVDISKSIAKLDESKNQFGIICDLTKKKNVLKLIETVVLKFGGIDVVVSNAGIFPPSAMIEKMDDKTWSKSLDVNLTSHQLLLQYAAPYMKFGIDPTFIIVASKNVPAPGPGAGAYSVAKAGLTQLARVAALELASSGIRVNTIHPNAVFDTAIWTDDVLKKRAKSYNMTVEEYKKNNLLKTEINSDDVAKLLTTIASNAFSKTTGAQIPIDGGNDRVI